MTTKTEAKQTQRSFTIQDFLFWAEKGLEMYGLKGWNVVTGKNTWIKEPASGKDGGRLQLSSSQLRSSDQIALNHLGYQVSLAIEKTLHRRGYDKYRIAGRAFTLGSQHPQVIADVREALEVLNFRAYLVMDGLNAIDGLLLSIDREEKG